MGLRTEHMAKGRTAPGDVVVVVVEEEEERTGSGEAAGLQDQTVVVVASKLREQGSVAAQKERAHTCWKVEVQQVARYTARRWEEPLGSAARSVRQRQLEVVEEHTGLQQLKTAEGELDPWAVAR